MAVSRTDLNRAIVAFRQALENPNSDAVTPAKQLYEWLIQPIENDLTQAGAETIIYAPDGQLRYIPLAALHDDRQWLAQRFRINNITAASLTDFNTRPASGELRVFAGAFTQGQYSVQVGDRQETLRGLPFAAQEVDNLAAIVPNTTERLNQAFNLDTILQMNDYNIVHLATHVAFLTGQPENSFILFGNGDRVTLRDVQS